MVLPFANRRSPRRIAVCIDDFGLHPGINRAATQLAEQGRVTAIACMVGAPHWVAGLSALHALAAYRVDLGLHLDFTEHPLDRSVRCGLPALIGRAYAGALDRKRVRAEVQAQFSAFEQALGRPPDFIDGHQHVHQLPTIRDAVMTALAQRAGTCRPWLRCTRRFEGAPLAMPQTWAQRAKPRIIEVLGAAALTRMLRGTAWAQNAHLLGVYDFGADAAHYRLLMQAWLQCAVDADLLMCHASQPTEVADAILPARLNEYQVLNDTSLAALMAQAGVTLQRMSTILSAP